MVKKIPTALCLILYIGSVGLPFLFCDRSPTSVQAHYTLGAVDSIEVKNIPLSVSTSLSASHTSVSRYGINPRIAMIGNSDNSFDVALYVSTTRQVQVITFDSSGARTGEFLPAAVAGARSLLGFSKVTDDGSFVIGWSKDNSFGQAGFEYWITRVDNTGNQLFSTRIFGDQDSALVGAEGQPGTASSGRIVYNPATKKICYYCGHTRKWSDSIRHQGGHIGFMDLAGNYYTANDWFFSHNFDQRLIVVDSFYYALAHGDAYRRTLGFSKWSDVAPGGRKLVDEDYFEIPGAIGDNTTNTQTGGVLYLSDNNFGVVFSSSVGRSNYDVCYKKISPEGVTLATVWLTGYAGSTTALYPRIAHLGENVLVAWEEAAGGAPLVRTTVVDNDGKLLAPLGTLDSVTLSPFYDMVSLPCGDAIWAILRASDTLSVCRIKP
jgi:hypothetical protein